MSTLPMKPGAGAPDAASRGVPPAFFGGGPPRAIADRTFFIPSFANATAFETDEGILLVDCGHTLAGGSILAAVRGFSDAPVHTIVITHGHVDHTLGVSAFDEEAVSRGRPRPRRLAHRNVLGRLTRYEKLRGHNEHLNSVQFGTEARFPEAHPRPDIVFDDHLSLDLGGERFEVLHDRGETDDAAWVWSPARKVLCTGDFFIGCSPNCGNPQKVQRYPDGWADALGRMIPLGAEVMCPGHGPLFEGKAVVEQALSDTQAYLRHLVDETVRLMNLGVPGHRIVQEVRPPADLAEKPYLQPLYDRPEFIVRNLLRLYGGWWDGRPAELLPAPEPQIAREVASLAGGVSALVARARALADTDLRLACHLAAWAASAAPDDLEARNVKRDVFLARAEQETSLMARGIFRAAAREAETSGPGAGE